MELVVNLLQKAKVCWKIFKEVEHQNLRETFPELAPELVTTLTTVFYVTYDFFDDRNANHVRRISLDPKEWMDSDIGDLIDFCCSKEFVPSSYLVHGTKKSYGKVVFLDTSQGGAGKPPAGRQAVESIEAYTDTQMNEAFFTHGSVTVSLYNQV